MKAVLLDLDGTLVDSRDGIVDAFQTALRAEGLPPVERRLVEATIGAPLPDAFAALTGRPDLTPALVLRYRTRYDEVCVPGSRPMPGAAGVLAALRAAGARLALVTSKGSHYPRTILEAHGLAHHFEAWVGFHDVVHPKPHPEPVLLACRLLDVRPQEAVMVGDTRYDVLAARAAGARAVGVLGGHGTREELEEAGAEVIVERLADVPEAVAR